MKQNKGITLVALVITIIVLLILAGVSISLVLGENGILGKATKSSTATKIAQITEGVQRAISSVQTDYYYNKYVEEGGATFKAFVEANLITAIKAENLDVSSATLTSGTAITAGLKGAKEGITVTVTVKDGTGATKDDISVTFGDTLTAFTAAS